MPQGLRKPASPIWHGFDRALDALALVAAAIIPFMFAAIVYDVTTRNLGGWRISWALAVTEYALLYVTALGAPWLLRERGHVSMEAFRVLLPRRVARAMERLVAALGLVACAIVTAALVPVTIQNFGVGDMRADFLQRWMLYAPVTVGFGLCAVQFLRFLLTGQSLYKGLAAEQDGL